MPALNTRAVVLLVSSTPSRERGSGLFFFCAAKVTICCETAKYSYSFLETNGPN